MSESHGHEAGFLVILTISVKDGERDGFLGAARECVRADRRLAGCVSAGLFEQPHERGCFALVEEWRTAADEAAAGDLTTRLVAEHGWSGSAPVERKLAVTGRRAIV